MGATTSTPGSGNTPGQMAAGARLPPAALDTDADTAKFNAAFPGAASAGNAPNSPAAAVDAPPKSAVAGAPASAGAKPNPSDSTAALPDQAAAVAPRQKGPSEQSEAPVAYPKDPIDPRPYTAVSREAPEYANMLDEAAKKWGVTPDRLAAHWNAESGLRIRNDDGSPIRHQNADGSVDMGPMQINSNTLKEIDPSGKLNPDDPKDAFELAARVIKPLDARYGQNTYTSVAAYNGGPGGADAIIAGNGNPSVMKYADDIFMGRRPVRFQPPMNIDPAQFKQVAEQQGPQGAIRMLAQTNPGTSMGDKWRALETASVWLELNRGAGMAGVAQARDQIQQLAHMGSNTAMMGAYQALQAGDGVGAAQLLARAHAFIQDNQMGRFGVDDKNQVWGEMLDEATGKPLGKAFQVTPQNLGAMMIQTRDPNKFNDAADKSAEIAAQIKFQQDHGSYYGDLIQARKDAIRERADRDTADNATKVQIANVRAGTSIDTAAMRLGQHTGGGALGLQDPKFQTQVTKELANPNSMISQMPDQKNLGVARATYADIRGSGVDPQSADEYTSGLFSGKYRMHTQGGLGYLTNAQGKPLTDARGRQIAVSSHIADMLGGTLKPMGPVNIRPAMRPPAIGGAVGPGASSAYPVATAIPAQNAPSTTALQ